MTPGPSRWRNQTAGRVGTLGQVEHQRPRPPWPGRGRPGAGRQYGGARRRPCSGRTRPPGRPGRHQGIGAVGHLQGGELLQLGGEPGSPRPAAAAFMKASPTSPRAQIGLLGRRTRPRLAPWGPARPAIVLVFYRRLPGGDPGRGWPQLRRMGHADLAAHDVDLHGRPTSLSGTGVAAPAKAHHGQAVDFACDRRENDGRSDGSSPIRGRSAAGARPAPRRSPSGAGRSPPRTSPGACWPPRGRPRPARRARPWSDLA